MPLPHLPERLEPTEPIQRLGRLLLPLVAEQGRQVLALALPELMALQEAVVVVVRLEIAGQEERGLLGIMAEQGLALVQPDRGQVVVAVVRELSDKMRPVPLEGMEGQERLAA